MPGQGGQTLRSGTARSLHLLRTLFSRARSLSCSLSRARCCSVARSVGTLPCSLDSKLLMHALLCSHPSIFSSHTLLLCLLQFSLSFAHAVAAVFQKLSHMLIDLDSLIRF
eukprot:3941421-Rhodomonas_salina.3